MALNFTCDNKQELSKLLCLLLGQDINHLSVQVPLSDLPEDKIESFLEDLRALNIPFIQHERDSSFMDILNNYDQIDDDLEDMELGLSKRKMRLSAKYERYNHEEVEPLEITDEGVLFRMKKLIGETQLLKIAMDHEVDIDIDEKAEIRGTEENNTKFTTEILEIEFEKTGVVSYNNLQALRQTLYMKGLLKEYQTKMTAEYDTDENGYRIIFYGKDPNKISQCKNKIEEVCENIEVLLEIPHNDDCPDEPTKILEFFTDRYKLKFNEIFTSQSHSSQIGMFFNKSNSNHIFFFFANCSNEQFKSIRDHIIEELKTLCLLYITPASNKDLEFGIPTNPFRTKLYLTELRNRSYLVIGKFKHFLSGVLDLFQESTLKNIDSFELLVRKFIDLNRKDLAAFGQIASEVLVEDSFHRFPLLRKLEKVYIILDKFNEMMSAQKEGEKEDKKTVSPLRKEEPILRENSHPKSPETRGRNDTDVISSVSINKSEITNNKRSNFEEDEEEEKVMNSDFSPNINKSQGPKESVQTERSGESVYKYTFGQKKIPFMPANENESLFQYNEELQEGDLLDILDPTYLKIEKLLLSKSPLANISAIMNTAAEEHWKQYNKSQNAYKPHQIKEFIVFLENDEDPLELISLNFDLDNVLTMLKGAVEPRTMRLFKDDNNAYNILVCLALFDNDSKEFINYYPAYYLIFKEI